MSELRDAIAAAVHRWCFEAGDDFYAAEDVLELPELQAIRQALRNLNSAIVQRSGYSAGIEWLRAMNLPPSVVAWVLEGKT